MCRRYGIECLFRFYSYGLEIKFRQDVWQDFQNLVLQDRDNIYGVEKLWAFLHYRKSSKPLNIHPELQSIVSKYKTVDDFAVERARSASLSRDRVGSLGKSPALSGQRHRANSGRGDGRRAGGKPREKKGGDRKGKTSAKE